MGELIRKRSFQVLGLIVLIISFVVIYHYVKKRQVTEPGNVAADVCGIKITRLEYQAAIRRRTMRIYQKQGAVRGADQESVHLSVFRQLANDKILESMANDRGVTVTPEDINAKIESLKSTIAAQNRDYAFQLAIETMGYNSEDELRADLKYEILEEKLTNAMFPIENYQVTDAEIAGAIPTHELQQIYFVMNPERPASENINDADQQTWDLARKVYALATTGGKNFGELAYQYSQDKMNGIPDLTGKNGPPPGYIGWVSKEKVSPKFWKTVATLEPGQISQPFQSEYGIHIIKCLNKRYVGSADFESFKKYMKDNLRFRKQKLDFAGAFAQIVAKKQDEGCIKLYDHELQANRYKTMGQYDKAIEEYNLALKENPDNPYYHADIGELLGKQGKRTEALAEFRKATEIAPRDTSLFFKLGEAYMGYGDHEKAFREFAKASDLALYDYEIHMRLQTIYTQLGLMKEATEEHKRYLHALEMRGGRQQKQQIQLPQVRGGQDEDLNQPMQDFGVGPVEQPPQLREPAAP